MGDDIGGPGFLPGLQSAVAAIFVAVGFFPAFVYVAYLFFNRKIKFSLLVVVSSFLLGIVASIGACILADAWFTSLSPSLVSFIINTWFLYAVVLEALLILIHFFFFRKSKQKAKSASAKK